MATWQNTGWEEDVQDFSSDRLVHLQPVRWETMREKPLKSQWPNLEDDSYGLILYLDHLPISKFPSEIEI